MSKEYIKYEIFNSTSHNTKKQKKRSKNIIQLHNNFKTPEKLLPVTLVTNYS